MGAFGLNASILDSSNLAWKLGLAARTSHPRDTKHDTLGARQAFLEVSDLDTIAAAFLYYILDYHALILTAAAFASISAARAATSSFRRCNIRLLLRFTTAAFLTGPSSLRTGG